MQRGTGIPEDGTSAERLLTVVEGVISADAKLDALLDAMEAMQRTVDDVAEVIDSWEQEAWDLVVEAHSKGDLDARVLASAQRLTRKPLSWREDLWTAAVRVGLARTVHEANADSWEPTGDYDPGELVEELDSQAG